MKTYWILLGAFGIAGCQFTPGEIVDESQDAIVNRKGSADTPSKPPVEQQPAMDSGMQPPSPVCDDTAITACYTSYKEFCSEKPDDPQCVDQLKKCESLRVDCSTPPSMTEKPGDLDRCAAEYLVCYEGSPSKASDCKLMYETCVGQTTPPPDPSCWDDVNACNAELASQCRKEEWNPKCDELALRCSEIQYKCEGMQPPSPDCDDTAITACYTSYKEFCSEKPEDPQCVEQLKKCESLRVDCSTQPEPPPPCDNMAVDACYAKYKDACAAQPETDACQSMLKECEAARTSVTPRRAPS